MHIFFTVNSELKYYHAVFGFVCTNKIANLAKKNSLVVQVPLKYMKYMSLYSFQ